MLPRPCHARWSTAALVAAALFALSACGEDERTDGPAAPAVTGVDEAVEADAERQVRDEIAEAGARQQIALTLTQVLAGDPGDMCGRLVTDRYVRRAYGDEDGCRDAQAKAAQAERVRVERVDVLPDSVAQASVRAVGGLYDGERLRAELVLSGRLWQLDSLRANVPVGP